MLKRRKSKARFLFWIIIIVLLFDISKNGMSKTDQEREIESFIKNTITYAIEKGKDLAIDILECFGYHGVLSSVKAEAAENKELLVAFVDVGQGDCIIITDGLHSAMVDTGMYMGYVEVERVMKSLKITTLDYLVLTHPDADHIGNADEIVIGYDVDKVIMTEDSNNTGSYADLEVALLATQTPVQFVEKGDVFQLGDATLTVLAPATDMLYEDTNSNSIVIEVAYGNIEYLLTGDATGKEVAHLLEANLINDCEVMKAAHHGGANDGCNSYELFDAANPEHVIISAGYQNDYGHPHEETMYYLKETNKNVYRTDLQGTICSYTDGKNIRWSVEETDNLSYGRQL